VIGGDLNSRPDSEDIAPWFDGTGLVSAQDMAGNPTWNTSPSVNADHRIDWIFGTPDLEFSDVAIPVTLASDHLPVFATVRVE
jgi:endonuclease/exonuclease/phosphatase family metal-dependent hydrolase